MPSFNDGRVLRSEDTTLKLYEIRELYKLLQEGENDFNDLELLRDIGTKFKRAMGNYYDQALNLMVQARVKVASGLPGPLADLEYSIKLEELDTIQGADYSPDIPLKMVEHNWIVARLKDKKYAGNETAVERALRILDAVKNAKGFQYTENDSIWVKGEPVPQQSDIPVIRQSNLRVANE